MPTYAGNVISYYKNGKKESEELYVTGKLLGGSTYYSKNGTIKKKVFYSLDNQKNRVERTEELNDSLGKPFLDKDGTGIYNETDEDEQVIEGQYLNGLKDKEWKTLNSKINETYFDEYDKGKYIKGKTIEVNGNIINYDDMEKLPEFNGGLKAFGSFLGKNLRYPAKARDYNIQGRVYLSFDVDKDGDLINLKVVKGVNEELDNEALRVMRMSPKWNPGTQRGRAVKVSYTVPIFFQLQTSSPSKTKHFGSYR
ncbi:MAG: TonB family protein [Oligoflexus sp.]|nr:TonB family protein [Pseudopedobacter sp.]